MRLRRLDLEFFGHFSGRSFDFGQAAGDGSDIHVVYGLNEAGKTTLMEGWLRLLYGFAPRNERYDFKHGRGALRVSAELEIDGAVRRFTRLPKRTGSLLDAAGAALPEAALSGALAGLSQDDYRKLLCLDDETIEAGGEEIAASEGDIGRLLFSAAAGVSDLSEVLDSAAEEAELLYRRRGSKSVFAGLKRRHEELSERIREADVSAHRYRQLRDGLAAAEADEADARAARRSRIEARDRLAALAAALPLRDELAATEAALAPLAAYPESLDIDPERLVAMLTERVGHAGEADRLSAELAAARTAREAIPRAPDLAALGRRLADLRPLRDRCAAAEGDLPRRREELAAAEADMRARLCEIGIEAGEAPERHVPGEPALRDLERKALAATEAARIHDDAAREADAAAAARDEATRRLERCEATLAALPDPAPLLARHDAERVAERAAAQREALRLAERRRDEALAALALGGVAFETVPDLPLTADAAAALAAELGAAAQEVAREEAALERAIEEEDRLRTEIETREAAPELATDAQAFALRAERDRLWASHRAALSQETAEAFERALRADDAAGAVRLAQSGTLGAIRERRVALAETERRRGDAEGALEAARQEREALSERLAGALSAPGLPCDTSATAFADWTRRAETAAAAERALSIEARSAGPALEAAERLRTALGADLGAGEAPLEALMEMARAGATERAEQARTTEAAREAALHAEETLRRRRIACEAAAARSKAAAAARDAAASAVQGRSDHPVEDALPVLRALREMEARRAGFAHQVAGMTRDAESFAAQLAPLLEADPGLSAQSAVAAFDALAARAEAAVEAETRWHSLGEEIAAMDAALSEARAALERLDAEAALLARALDPAIPTDTLDALRTAVGEARTARTLRARRDELERQILGALGAGSRAEADAALDGSGGAELAASLEEAERDLAALEERCRAASAALGAARHALAEVTGGAEAAALVASRQTVELEMEETMLRHLELRLGHRQAETAIRRYRDVHRSGMMASAEAAFRELTGGAYSRLAVQGDGAGEELVAVQDGGGAAKRVQDMSKGTRFQLYLALRAAAYDQLAATGTVLPFFCDDVFETFDEERTRAACALLRRIGRAGQAVYLTHHRHVVEIAEEVCGADLRIHAL